MKKMLYVCCIVLLSVACKPMQKVGNARQVLDYGSPSVKQELINDQMFFIKEHTVDEKYGYTEENPIMVGGANEMEGPINERRFLNALLGPNGEEISYQRVGSCCHFSTKNLRSDRTMGLLDRYAITYEGLKTPIILYINMYDSDILKVPVGFTLRYNISF